MRAVAVICEYNPFHKGHEYLISEIKKKYPLHAVISVMSGNTVQRGDFAIYDKYSRAKAAVTGGSDVVVELPFPFSSSAGEQFARAGVHIAEMLQAEYLVFGSELGDIEELKLHAKNTGSYEFDKLLGDRARSNPNESFIRLREQVYYEMFGFNLPSGGNDMLGTEYIRVINEKNYKITPICFKRKSGFSATKSREALYSENEEEAEILMPNVPENPIHPGLRGIEKLILGSLRLGLLRDNGDGIVNALISCAKKAKGYDEFISLLPTATYTLARLRRELISALFGVTEEMKNALPQFTVLLGASKLGTDYLKSIRKTSKIPILTKQSDVSSYPEIERNTIRLCERADSIYRLAYGDVKTAFFEKPFIEK